MLGLDASKDTHRDNAVERSVEYGDIMTLFW
jgi:hypothetical protein